MVFVNRAALVVRPREPFIAWAASVDPDLEDLATSLRGHTSVYLVAEDPNGCEESAPLELYFREVFEQELGSWYLDETAWPQVRDLATFHEWFEVQAESEVIDLEDDGALVVEDEWRSN